MATGHSLPLLPPLQVGVLGRKNIGTERAGCTACSPAWEAGGATGPARIGTHRHARQQFEQHARAHRETFGVMGTKGACTLWPNGKGLREVRGGREEGRGEAETTRTKCNGEPCSPPHILSNRWALSPPHAKLVQPATPRATRSTTACGSRRVWTSRWTSRCRPSAGRRARRLRRSACPAG